jgi:hypothetical protein
MLPSLTLTVIALSPFSKQYVIEVMLESFLGFGTLFNMAEVTNAKAAVFNLFNISSALLNAMTLCQLIKAIEKLPP